MKIDVAKNPRSLLSSLRQACRIGTDVAQPGLSDGREKQAERLALSVRGRRAPHASHAHAVRDNSAMKCRQLHHPRQDTRKERISSV